VLVPVIAASIFDPIYQTLGAILAGFYSLFGSFGLAIALLTITVRVAMIPLTAKQVRSQQAMQRLSPQLKALQAKHKGDRQKLNEETMKFYKEHSFNPLSGCLPVILQAPLFIVLYRLINGLSTPPYEHVPLGSAIYDTLKREAGRMFSWGMDLSRSAQDQSGGLSGALPVYFLIALVMVTGFYQQRQMAARLPKDGINAQMAVVGKVFPFFMGIISLSIPAGVVVYFIFSNLWQIGQQAFTFRGQPLPDASPSTAKAGPDKPKPVGKTKTSSPGDPKGPREKTPAPAKGPTKGGRGKPSGEAKPQRGSTSAPNKKPTPKNTTGTNGRVNGRALGAKPPRRPPAEPQAAPRQRGGSSKRRPSS